jgi:beta-propeller repeat-containing protein
LNQVGKSGGGAYTGTELNNLTNNQFVENKAGRSGGGFICASPGAGNCIVTDNEFSLNTAGKNGGGALVVGMSIIVNLNRFHNNRAGSSGGGLWASDDDGGLKINNNQFIGNRAVIDGGGGKILGDPSAFFYNNVLDSNKAGRNGGGVYSNPSGNDYLINNTLTNNESGAEGGGAYISGHFSPTIFNNIIRGNRSSSDGNDLFVNNDSVSLFNNNLGQNANFETANSPDLVITDTTNYSQGDNIKSDPLLTDDFHLQYGSPAIDAGDNAAVQGWKPIYADFEGDPRIINGNSGGKPIVDIGADENARADVNRDGCVDRTDTDIILHNVRADSEDPEDDINEDGTVNRADARVVVRLFTNGAPCKKVVLEYAKRAGGTEWNEKGRGIAVDIAGNSVVTGSFTGIATFGAGELNETMLTTGGRDIFVAKYSPDGSLFWAIQTSGTSVVDGFGIAVDATGSIVVTGSFRGKTTFGKGEQNETILTNGGMFVAKYTPDGFLVWAVQTEGTESGTGHSIAVDAAGNSVVTGSFYGNTAFGMGETNETVLKSAGSSDIFIAKYAPNSSLIWAIQAGGTESDKGLGIAIGTSDNSVVTGHFRGSAIFGAGKPNETVLISSGSTDIFIAKYAPDGSLVWAAQAGGASSDDGNGIAIDSAGNSVVTGYFLGTAAFGTGEPNETVLTGRGIFVAKYASDSSLIWTIQAYSSGGNGIFIGTKGIVIAVDTTGNILVTGSFSDSATFGSVEPNKTVLTSAGGLDIFVAKYAPDGSHDWATQAGGTVREIGQGIAVDAAGNSVVTGFFSGLVTFGADEPNETVLTSAGREDIFVAKFKSTQFGSTR